MQYSYIISKVYFKVRLMCLVRKTTNAIPYYYAVITAVFVHYYPLHAKIADPFLSDNYFISLFLNINIYFLFSKKYTCDAISIHHHSPDIKCLIYQWPKSYIIRA